MKIIVITDTHNQTSDAERIIAGTKGVTDVIHLGDMEADALHLQEIFPHINIRAVRGNNDWFSRLPEDIIIEEAGYKIFATHGHNYGVRSALTRIALKGKSVGADIVLFGHTHLKCDEEYDGMRIVNPSNRGYAIIDENGIEVKEY